MRANKIHFRGMQMLGGRLQRGLSLVESLVALGVASALAATGVPAANEAFERHRLASTTNELITTVNFARSEAIRRSARVVIAAKTPGRWTDGWRVFADADDDGQLDEGEVILRESTPSPGSTAISAHFGATHSRDALSYSPVGVVRKPGGEGLVLGRITLSAGKEVRTLCFSSLTMRVVMTPRCS
jgi:type IV fimbrial biogenesis protein FimT